MVWSVGVLAGPGAHAEIAGRQDGGDGDQAVVTADRSGHSAPAAPASVARAKPARRARTAFWTASAASADTGWK